MHNRIVITGPLLVIGPTSPNYEGLSREVAKVSSHGVELTVPSLGTPPYQPTHDTPPHPGNHLTGTPTTVINLYTSARQHAVPYMYTVQPLYQYTAKSGYSFQPPCTQSG